MESSRKKSSSVVGSSRRHRTYLYFVISKYGRQYGWNGRKFRIDGRFLGGVWDEYTEYRYAAGIFCNGDRHDTCAWKQYVCGNTGNGDPVERGRWTHGGIYLYPAREKIIIAKFAAVIASLVLFTIFCAGCYQIGFLALGEKEITGEFLRFIALQLMMNTEIASICFLISAVSKKNRAGIGISIPVILYVYDLMARVVPDLEDVKFISPFSYANATEIFSREQPDRGAFVLGVLVIAALTVISGRIYAKRDLAS